MLGLLILSIIVLASARPDARTGYNYEKPGYSYPNKGYNSGSVQGNREGGLFGHGSGVTTNFAQSERFGSQEHENFDEPLISKHFYIHAAPEDNDYEKKSKHFVLGRAQKFFRVVFIKAPAPNASSLSAEFAPKEEKTVIYVLSQKESEIDLNNIATPAPTQPSKPEVYFIKYKTPEEAFHAQREIQAQYDALGGSSEVTDEGVVPVSSVIGSVSTGSSSGSSTGSFGSASSTSSNHFKQQQNHKNEYLPPTQ